jgi:hypothetical protein
MSFCTAINCIDGRIQMPVTLYLKNRFKVDFVDIISEPAPNRILAEQNDKGTIESILCRVNLSTQKHKSKQIAIIGHFDCAGNPGSMKKQIHQIRKSIAYLKGWFPKVEVIGLWVDGSWRVREIV